MVEYPHLPDGIVTTVLPEHFKVKVSEADSEQMMATTRMYSKVNFYTRAYSVGLWWMDGWIDGTVDEAVACPQTVASLGGRRGGDLVL